MEKLSERWRKPSRSGNNGQCVEARLIDDEIEVRNSNRVDAGSVRFTRAEWSTFIACANEFEV